MHQKVDTVSGFLFQLGDSADFQEKLLAIHSPEKKLSQIIQNARNTMVDSYSRESATQQYLDILT